MIKVFAPIATIDIYDEWLGKSEQFVRCENQTEVLSQNVKIACLPLYFDNDYDIDYHQFDLLLISDIEFNHLRPINEWLAQLQIKNYLVAVGGLEGYTVSGDFVYRPWWTFNLMRKNTPQHQTTIPKFDFEILLGAKKPHRDFVMAKTQKSFLLDTSIVNYRSVFPAPVQQDSEIETYIKNLLGDDELKYPYISPNSNQEWEVAPEITYQVSDQVPWGIYNQTKYSTILETIYERSFFFTEKPAKVLFGKRIFVAFSCQHYLQQMRDILGFRTFNGVIDESYDTEENNITRFEMAFEQMEWLAKQDYHSIREKTKDIVEYNYERLFDLRQETASQMLQMVYNKIEEIKC